MDTGEFGTEQVKIEVDSNDFDEAFQTDTKVKHEPRKINTFSECGRYEDRSGTDFIDKPEYVDPSEVCEDISTNECKTEQVKHENDFDIVCEHIKPEIEIVEEKLCELDRFCEVCNSSSCETGFIDSKNNKFQCICQKQNYSINLQSQEITEDLKLPFLGLTSDSGLQRLMVQDKTRSEDECSNNSGSPAAPQRSSMASSSKVRERINTGVRPYHCQSCSKSFFSGRHLKDHIIKIHTREKPLHCEICSKSFNASSTFRAHQKIHTGETIFHCQVCSKSFMYQSKLKLHENIHTGEKPYHCEVCSKSFMFPNLLKRHERVHTGEKPYHCKVCSKSFTSANALKVHGRFHTGEKPYHCQICSKSFCSNKHLKAHSKIHTGEKPFNCKICSKSFVTKSTRNVHLKIHTREKPS